MTVMSYNGHLDWGLLADRSMMPDIWDLYGNLETELTALSKAAG
jgi:hypothetical protein